jgi:hypothetical protein
MYASHRTARACPRAACRVIHARRLGAELLLSREEWRGHGPRTREGQKNEKEASEEHSAVESPGEGAAQQKGKKGVRDSWTGTKAEIKLSVF